MSVFIWEDGARFDDVINGYMNMEDTSGIDPRFPPRLVGNSSVMGNLVNASEILNHNISVQ